MSEEKNQARKFEIMLSNEEAERLSDMAGEHGLTVSQLIADLLHDLIRRQIYGSYSGEHASEWLWRCDYGNSLCSFLQFLAVQGLLTAALDDWDGIEDAKNDLTYYKEHPEEAEPDEVEFIEEWVRDSQIEFENDFWNNYVSLLKENGVLRNPSLDEEMKKVLEWRAERKRLLENG